MDKRNNYRRIPHSPIGVLLSKRSEDSLKKAYKGQVPLPISYTEEDLKVLRGIIKGIDPFGVDFRKRAILRNIQKATEKSDPHETFQRLFYDKWGNTTKEAYEIMYETPMEDLPLHINNEYTSYIVKWRLLIKK